MMTREEKVILSPGAQAQTVHEECAEAKFQDYFLRQNQGMDECKSPGMRGICMDGGEGKVTTIPVNFR